MTKSDLHLKYAFLDNFLDTVKSCKDDSIAKYLVQLRDLITYQMQIIHEQRMEIVSLKHKEAWKHYDKPIENYDPVTRKYIERPEKSGNMSC